MRKSLLQKKKGLSSIYSGIAILAANNATGEFNQLIREAQEAFRKYGIDGRAAFSEDKVVSLEDFKKLKEEK